MNTKGEEDKETRRRGDKEILPVPASPCLPVAPIIGIGVDIVETARVEALIERHGDRFLHRIFTAREIDYCKSMKFSARNFAARFAAKEAVSKAFGTGIGAAVGWQDIEVCRGRDGRPYIELHGNAKDLARQLAVTDVLISMSHADHYAVANAVIQIRQGPELPPPPRTQPIEQGMMGPGLLATDSGQ